MLPAILISALAVPIVAALAHRQLRRRRAARALVIDTPNGIDEGRFVPIGGIDQWIVIRGEDRANPVLLEVHGGPGASNTIFTHRTRAWEQHFTIVRWDMRGAGRTFGRGGKHGQGELTLERIIADAIEVTEYVRKRLNQDKVILLANSLGTVFGLRLARQRPDLFAAYVGTDQNLGVTDGGYLATIARLRAAGRRRDVATLEKMGADRTRWSAHDWATEARLTTQSDPRLQRMMKELMLPSLWFSPQHGLRDLRHLMAGMSFSERLFIETSNVDPWRDGTRFEIPFFIFQGEHDLLTPVGPAERFIREVDAPVKAMELIRAATHFAAFWQPAQFLDLLMTHVRPLVVAQRSTRARAS